MVHAYTNTDQSYKQIHLTLHRQNKTGRNTATAMVIGMNQLSSEAYGSWLLGPEVRLNLSDFDAVSPHSTSLPSLCSVSRGSTSGGGRAGIFSVLLAVCVCVCACVE